MMDLNNLSRKAIHGLRTVSGPARYLFPGPGPSTTGDRDQSVLLLSPERHGAGLRRPGFHRLYRMIQERPDHHAEHVFYPSDDFLDMTESREVPPWSLESRRSVFSFPTWVAYLSWPGEFVQLRTLLDRLRHHPTSDGIPFLCVVTAFSLPFLELEDPAIDLILEGPSLPSTPKPFSRFLDALLDHDTERASSRGPTDASTSSSVDSTDWTRIQSPIPNLHHHEIENQYWTGTPVSFDRNRSLQKQSWPRVSFTSPEHQMQHVRSAIRHHGLQTISIGTFPDQKPAERNNMILELSQRIRSSWPDQPICYRLHNPHPKYELWQYDFLLRKHMNEPLNVHLGHVRTLPETQRAIETTEPWLPFFLKAGGPKMSFSVDFSPTSSDVQEAIPPLCESLDQANSRYIQGKGDGYLYLQPELSDPEQWISEEELTDIEHSIQRKCETYDLSIEIQRPTSYQQLRDWTVSS